MSSDMHTKLIDVLAHEYAKKHNLLHTMCEQPDPGVNFYEFWDVIEDAQNITDTIKSQIAVVIWNNYKIFSKLSDEEGYELVYQDVKERLDL